MYACMHVSMHISWMGAGSLVIHAIEKNIFLCSHDSCYA